jgi:cellulose synthase/poly-beta-1,6-N-acetylglucosamine synthase-like glycosyltransferase
MDQIMKLNEAFTVLLPIYQREDLVENFSLVLKSIYENTLLPDDLIVLIDGDISENFLNIILSEKNKYNFKILKNKKIGLAQVLNQGISHVNTNWIARMDGDDLCEKDRFENSIAFIKKKNLDLFGGQISEFSVKSNSLLIKKVPCSSESIKKMIKFRNPFNHMTVFYKTNLVKKVGGYPDIYLKEDYALWCKLISIGARVGNMDKIVVRVKNDELFNRRGGIKYLQSEIELQKILIKSNLSNFFFSVFICSMRILVFMLPNILKKKIYTNFLRSSS